MLTKYIILIFLKVLINNSLGQNEIPSAWKTEMKKMFTEELGTELNNLKQNLEKRFEQISKLGNNLGDEFERKLEQLEENIEKNFEKKQNTSQTEEWINTTLKDAISLNGRAVIAGYESDGSPLWIKRSYIEDDNIAFGKLNSWQQCALTATLNSNITYYYYTRDNATTEVLCALPEKVRWVECRNGYVPPNAFVGGGSYNGEKVYVGRAREEDALIPGWVLPSAKSLNIVHNEKSKTRNTYEVLCLV